MATFTGVSRQSGTSGTAALVTSAPVEVDRMTTSCWDGPGIWDELVIWAKYFGKPAGRAG